MINVDDRLATFTQSVIEYEGFLEGFEKLKMTLTMQKAGHPEGMFLLGSTGVGKTTLLKKFTAELNDGSTEDSVLWINCPTRPTIKQVFMAIANEIQPGVMAGRKTFEDAKVWITQHLKEMSYRILIIDEAQHMTPVAKCNDYYQIADDLKNLMTNTGVSIILSGLPHAKSALNDHSELQRRFSFTHYLRPFSMSSTRFESALDPDNKKTERDIYLSYLGALFIAVGDKNSPLLDNPEIGARFFVASKGSQANLSNIFYKTIMLKRDGTDHLTLKDFRTGFKSAGIQLSDDIDPFYADNETIMRLIGSTEQSNKYAFDLAR